MVAVGLHTCMSSSSCAHAMPRASICEACMHQIEAASENTCLNLTAMSMRVCTTMHAAVPLEKCARDMAHKGAHKVAVLMAT